MKSKKGYYDNGFNWLILIVIIILICVGAVPNKNVGCIYKENDIVALNLNSQIDGLFFIWVGGIGEKQYYYTMLKDVNETLKLNKDSAYEVSVVEGNYTPKRVDYSLNFLTSHQNGCPYDGVVYYVPEGTVKKIVNIDISKMN
jgi:hypothetical protein